MARLADITTSVLVTTSKAPVTTSVAPVTTSVLVTTSKAPVTSSKAPVTTSVAPAVLQLPHPNSFGLGSSALQVQHLLVLDSTK